MKKIIVLCLLQVLLTLSFGQVMVFSSDFEDELSYEWSSTLSTGLTTFDRSTENHSGNYGLHMVFSASTQKGNLTTSNVIYWKKGEVYRVSFWYKVAVPGNNNVSNIKFFSHDGTKIGQVNLFDWNCSEWTPYFVDFIPEVDDPLGGYLLFSFRPSGTGIGDYFFDSFRVEKMEVEKDFWEELKTGKVVSDPSIQWVQFGPGMSGNNKSAFWHPTDPNVLFIGPNMGNSYGSWDRGKTYHSLLNDDESDFKRGRRGPIELTSLDFSRQQADFGMCTDERNQGIYYTEDRGHQWTRLATATFDGKYVNCVCVDPKNDNIWYAAGGRLRNLGSNLFPNTKPKGTLADPASLNKIWKSTDKGKSWVLKADGLAPETGVETILVDPKDSEVVYASTSTGFYKSNDGGEHWVAKNEGLDYTMLRAFAKHYNKEDDILTFYVISNPMWKASGTTVTDEKGGIFKSINRGESWVKVEGNISMDMRYFQENKAVKKSYANCVSYVLGMTYDEFISQYPDLPSQITMRFNTIEVDPNDVNNIYLNNEYSNASRNNFMPGQVWRSKDGGRSWFVTLRNGHLWEEGSKDKDYWEGRGNPMRNNLTLRYLKSWVNRDGYDRKGCNFVRFNADGTVLHTQMAKISLMSYDKGDHWVDIDDEYTQPNAESYVGAGNSNVPGHGFFQHPKIRNKVFCMAGENSLWVTNNEGEKVRPGAQGADFHPLLSEETSLSWYAIHPQDTTIHYALFFRQAMKGKFMRSSDNGQTWKEQGIAIPPWSTQPHSGDQSIHQLHLIIDPEDANNMYFVVPKKARDLQFVGDSQLAFGVHKSSDEGKKWKESNVGLPQNTDATNICFDPENSEILYVAVQNANGGLFKSIDKGETWSELESTKNISQGQGINDIHFARDGKAYISAGTKNGPVDGGGVWMSVDHLITWTKIFDYPWTNRIESAFYNPKVLLVSTLANNTIGGINAGVYLSKDGGENWIKINRGNGQSDRVNDIAIDNYTPGKYYVSTYGSGWYVAHDPNPGPTTPVEGLSFIQKKLILKVNCDSLLTPLFEPSYAFNREVDWLSENPDVASVTEEGVVSGVSVGETIIRATSQEGAFTAKVVVEVQSAVGVNNLLQTGIKAYPNPTNSEITITSDRLNLRNSIVLLYNLSGEVVLQHSPVGTDSRVTLSLAKLVEGMYCLQINSGGRRYQQSVVKF